MLLRNPSAAWEMRKQKAGAATTGKATNSITIKTARRGQFFVFTDFFWDNKGNNKVVSKGAIEIYLWPQLFENEKHYMK